METVIYLRSQHIDRLLREKVYMIRIGKTRNRGKHMKEILTLKTQYRERENAALAALKLSQLTGWPFIGDIDYEFGQAWFIFERLEAE